MMALEWDVKSDKLFGEYLRKCPSLDGKVVAVTGTTSGTGSYISQFVLRKNAKALICLNRESERSKEAMKFLENEKAKFHLNTELISIPIDLMDFSSVKAAAKRVNETCAVLGGLDVLLNNAGIFGFPDKRTVDGYEVQMQVNYLSHFFLMKEVLPSLMQAYDHGAEVRVCQHSSFSRNMSGTYAEPKYFKKCPPGTLGGEGVTRKINRYHQSKLAASCFAMMLNKKLVEQGIDTSRFKSVLGEPGLAHTDLMNNTRSEQFTIMGHIASFCLMIVQPTQSAADGATGVIQASFGENVESGDFFIPLKGNYGRPTKIISKGQALTPALAKQERYTLNEKSQEVSWDQAEAIFGSFFGDKN